MSAPKKAESGKPKAEISQRVYTLNQNVLELIWLERLRQQGLIKHGRISWSCATAGIDHHKKLTVLTEEVGEVAEALLAFENHGTAKSSEDCHRIYRERLEHLREEIVQVAAVAVAWLESLEAS